MRLFVALDLPSRLRTRLADHRAPDALDARWTDPAQYHVTLRFIGDADAETAAQYEDALSDLDAPVPDCTPYGLDVLPSRRNPSVLIVGLERTDTLLSLYQSVSDALESVGLDPEDRTYRPHVTLARLNDGSPRTAHQFLDTHAIDDLPSFRPQQFHLYESTLTPDGAVHDRRASFPLTP